MGLFFFIESVLEFQPLLWNWCEESGRITLTKLVTTLNGCADYYLFVHSGN